MVSMSIACRPQTPERGAERLGRRSSRPDWASSARPSGPSRPSTSSSIARARFAWRPSPVSRPRRDQVAGHPQGRQAGGVVLVGLARARRAASGRRGVGRPARQGVRVAPDGVVPQDRLGRPPHPRVGRRHQAERDDRAEQADVDRRRPVDPARAGRPRAPARFESRRASRNRPGSARRPGRRARPRRQVRLGRLAPDEAALPARDCPGPRPAGPRRGGRRPRRRWSRGRPRSGCPRSRPS